MFKVTKKIISVVLVIALMLSSVGVSVFADSINNEQSTTATTVNESTGEKLLGEKPNNESTIVNEEVKPSEEEEKDKENQEEKEEPEEDETNKEEGSSESQDENEESSSEESKDNDEEGTTESAETSESTSEESSESTSTETSESTNETSESVNESSSESSSESTSEGTSESSSESTSKSTSESTSTSERTNENATTTTEATSQSKSKIEKEEKANEKVASASDASADVEENSKTATTSDAENINLFGGDNIELATNSNVNDLELMEQESTSLFGAHPDWINYGTLIDLDEADRLNLDYNWYNRFFGTTYDKSDIKKIEFKAGVDINGRGWNLLEEVNDTTHGKVYKLLSKFNVDNNSLWSNWSGFRCNDIYPYPPHGTEDGAAPYKYLRDTFYPSFSQYYKDNMILMTTTEEGWGRGGYPHTLRTFDSYIRIPTGDEVDAFADAGWDTTRMKEKLKNDSNWWILEHIHRDTASNGEGAAVFPADGNYDPRHGGDKYTSYQVYRTTSGVRPVMTMTKEGLKPEPGTAGEPAYTYEIYNTDDTSATNRKLIGLAFLFNNAEGGYNLQINLLYGNAFKLAIADSQALFVNFNNCKEIKGLDLLDFSQVTDMSSMFEGCSTLDTISFVNATLTKLQDTFGANATNINSMFKDCEALTNVNFLPDNFAHSATSMVSTFENTKLSTCPTNINTSNVTDMTRTFAKLQSTTFNFDSIDLSACTNVTEMFADSTILTTITVNENYLGLPNTVTTDTDMFKNSTNLVGGGGFSYKDQFASGDFARVDYGGIIPGYFTTTDTSIYNNIDITITSTWRTNFATEGALTGARKIIFTHENLPGGSANDIDMPLKVNGVDIIGKAFLMDGDGSLIMQFLPQIEKLNTTDTWGGFFKDFENVTNIEGFDLIDTSPITTLEQTFNNCRNLATISIADFNTTNITNIESAFEGCENFVGFVGDIPKFSSLVNAQYAFKGCSKLKTIDIDSFFTPGLIFAKEMFRNCSSLTNIYTSQRIVNCSLPIDTYNSENMFDGCTSLTGGQGTVYMNGYPKNINMANVDFGGIKPGYFTLTNTSLYNNVTFTVPNTWYNIADYLRSKANVKKVMFIEGSPAAGDFDIMYDMDGSYDKAKLYLKIDTDGKYIAKIYTGCSLIRKTKLSTTMANFFSGFTSLTTIEGWDKVDMTSTTNMKGMFKNCTSLTSLDLTLFDTSNITNMSEMFRGCTNLTTITVTTAFVVSNATRGDNMFTGCFALVGGHGTTFASKFAVDHVTAVDKTFATLDARHGFDGYFTGTATGYNVNSITVNTAPLTTYYVGEKFLPNGLILNVTWDDNVTTQIPYNITTETKFTFDPPTTQALTSTDTTETITFGGQTTPLTLTIDPGTAYTLSQNWFTGAGVNKNTVKSISFAKFPEASPSTVTSEWDIPDSNGLKGYVIANGTGNDIVIYAPQVGAIIGAQDSRYLFSDVSLTDAFENLTTFNNLSYLVTSRMTNMSFMFAYSKKIQSLDLSSFDTFNATTMTGMFDHCEELVSVNTSTFDTKYVVYMDDMFNYCKKLTDVNTDNFVTSNVRDMTRMFNECNELTSLDVSSFNTSGVTNLQSMFNNCLNLTSLDLSGFDMNVAMDMHEMFKGCAKLTSLGNVALSSREVTTCKSMFEGCEELTNIDLSNFSTSNIVGDGFENMFFGCKKVAIISLGNNFVLGGATTLANMFNGCEALESINLITFASNSVNNVTAMFKNNKSLKTIIASNSFAVKNKTGNDMFEGCDVLEGGEGTTFADARVTNSSYAQVDKGPTNPGYFTWDDWEIIEYTVNYDSNGASGGTVPESQIGYSGEDLTLRTNTGNLWKTGKYLMGWDENQSATNPTYTLGGTMNKTFTSIETVTLYAIWGNVPYTIRLNSNDSTGKKIDIPAKSDIDTILPNNSWGRTGYTFLGWNTESNATANNWTVIGEHYNPKGAVVNKTISEDQANLIYNLYAVWKKNSNPSPSDGGGSSGGSDGAGPLKGPITVIPTTYISGVKTISATFNDTQVKWNYDPTTNKYKLTATINGQSVPVSNGFYVINDTQNVNSATPKSPMPNTYYFNSNGEMLTGWLITSDSKKYLASVEKDINEGKLVAGWKVIDGYWYFFDFEGALLINSITPDGYYVGADGRWVR